MLHCAPRAAALPCAPAMLRAALPWRAAGCPRAARAPAPLALPRALLIQGPTTPPPPPPPPPRASPPQAVPQEAEADAAHPGAGAGGL